MKDRAIAKSTVDRTIDKGGSIVGSILRRGDNTTFKGAVKPEHVAAAAADDGNEVITGYDGIRTIRRR
jgi:hypothetical protein